MKVAEIRQRFLDYFKNHKHEVVASSAVVPSNDPTLLFTNAGMVQFKDTFLGKEKRAYSRATSCQKCIRAGGKHNDLENVGYTARHHTFFEMLGNFSFGDYFKEDAIRMAWGFIRDELKLPIESLYVTVFETDDEAFEIWEKKIGFPKERIYRFGEADNFWSMGDVGPCGPCSEIFVDRGEAYTCEKGADCKMGCDCDRFMEFWNLVFMQYNRDAEGNLTPLPKPSVDTGMGLERMASILQDTKTNYEIDSFYDILKYVGQLCSKPYNPDSDEAFAYRVIGDHARAISFLIADGVMPSNEGRGYVLRRILRRAIRYGKNLGFSEAFLYKVCLFVVEQMGAHYPELKDQKSLIEKAVIAEEEQFLKTLERGLNLLDEELKLLENSKKKILSGEVAFKLYDTFGFPVDLTRVICQEKDFEVDEAGFQASMAKQKDQSRKNWKGSGESAVGDIFHVVSEKLKEDQKEIKFSGYTLHADEGELYALVTEKGLVDRVDAGMKAQAVFLQTPFYGESGGQSGDKGHVSGNGVKALVSDVQKPVGDLIVADLTVVEGSLKVGQSYTQQTDVLTRELTERNHTATHMLHWALRDTLGDHVKQAGSLVTADLLRFDFSHFQALTEEELSLVEKKINDRIISASNVGSAQMTKDEATQKGAIAFFGEKYGETVRVVSVGEFSTELCGGTHVKNTAEINLFKIVSEASVAAGVRRIVAYTSKAAIEYLSSRDKEVKEVREYFKATSVEDVMARLEKMTATEKELRKEIADFKASQMGNVIGELLANPPKVKDTPVVVYELPFDSTGVKALRDMGEKIKNQLDDSICVLAMKDEEKSKAFVLVAKGKNAPKDFKSGNLIKELAPFIDGRGGGKPDMAQAGGTKLEGIAEMLKVANAKIEAMI